MVPLCAVAGRCTTQKATSWDSYGYRLHIEALSTKSCCKLAQYGLLLFGSIGLAQIVKCAQIKHQALVQGTEGVIAKGFLQSFHSFRESAHLQQADRSVVRRRDIVRVEEQIRLKLIQSCIVISLCGKDEAAMQVQLGLRRGRELSYPHEHLPSGGKLSGMDEHPHERKVEKRRVRVLPSKLACDVHCGVGLVHTEIVCRKGGQ
mmetsp:Transcript_12597/g.38541  ORF Transcript_12597/g.38541 Transcript_12597/m.38541 type:complete len:204 (+) Transcript_12597:1470-2081(+)